MTYQKGLRRMRVEGWLGAIRTRYNDLYIVHPVHSVLVDVMYVYLLHKRPMYYISYTLLYIIYYTILYTILVLDAHPLPVRGQSRIRHRPDTSGGQRRVPILPLSGGITV